MKIVFKQNMAILSKTMTWRDLKRSLFGHHRGMNVMMAFVENVEIEENEEEFKKAFEKMKFKDKLTFIKQTVTGVKGLPNSYFENNINRPRLGPRIKVIFDENIA